MFSSEDEKITIGTTSLEKGVVVHQKITDPFKRMIRNALKEQRIILLERKNELEIWDGSAQQRFKKAFGLTNEKARQWILEGINKEILLNNEIPISNFKKTKENVYASVNSSDLEHNINIGEKFSKAPLTGENSQVVTLCHEMSHFDDILGTKDLGEGSPRSYAVSLARKCDERTMQSSYNFEMYFV